MDKVNKTDIALFLIILLSIMAVLGLIRLKIITPAKEPIKIEQGI